LYRPDTMRSPKGFAIGKIFCLAILLGLGR
jgi:hypothetical protein